MEEKSKSARVSGQVGENQEMIITEKTIVVRGQWTERTESQKRDETSVRGQRTESQSQMHDGSWQSESQSQASMHDDGSWQSHWQKSEWQEKEHADWKWQDQNETQARPKAKAMPPTDQAQPVQQQAVAKPISVVQTLLKLQNETQARPKAKAMPPMQLGEQHTDDQCGTPKSS